MITIWTAAIQYWQKWDLLHVLRTVHEHWISGLFMRFINASLADSFRVFQPNHKNIGWKYLFCLLRFPGHRGVFTTGASQQLVMTQYPQSLRQYILFVYTFRRLAFKAWWKKKKTSALHCCSLILLYLILSLVCNCLYAEGIHADCITSPSSLSSLWIKHLK